MPKKVLRLAAEVMKKIGCLRLFTALSVGLSILAIIILSYWSSTVKLLGLEGNYAGKKTLHLFRVLKFLSGWGS